MDISLSQHHKFSWIKLKITKIRFLWNIWGWFGPYVISFYYIDTDEIPGFFQWRKFGIQWKCNFYHSHLKISRLSWRTSEISSWTREDKIRIHARACNILYTFLFRNITTTAAMNQYTVSTRVVRNVFFARTSSHTWRPLASGLWRNVLSVMLVSPDWRRMWVASEQKLHPLWRECFSLRPHCHCLLWKATIRVEHSKDALNKKKIKKCIKLIA